MTAHNLFVSAALRTARTFASRPIWLLVAGFALIAPTAEAVNLTVNSTADVATNFGACGNAAQTTSSGSLREAVCAANNAGATSSTITVTVPGTYTLTNGELQMGKVAGSNITLNGTGAGSTIISGNNASRVFDLDVNVGGGVTTSISGVTITNGAVTTFGGAGIIAGSGNKTTRDVLTVSNCTFTNNHVNSATTNKYGGALEFQGGSLTVTNCTFSGNSSGSSSGSALEYQHFDVAASEQLTVSGSTFSGNTTNASVANINVGGALHMSGVSAAIPMSVTNCVFNGNTAVGSGTGIPQGGAIFSEGGSLTVTECTLTSNSVAGGSNPQGGAISVLGGAAQVHYNRITGNTGATGSGVSLGVSSGATLDATNNWWGCTAGPGTTGCDTAAGGPTVSPRLVLTATASPATIVGPNATSTITATLTQNSDGTAIATSNLDAFQGLPIAFSDPQPSGATLTAASVNLAAGSASTTYNSQNTSGPGHVVATLDNGSSTAALTVNRAPAVTTNPSNQTVNAGQTATFTAAANGFPSPTVQWQVSTNGGSTFSNIAGATSTTLTFAAASSQDGNQYRAVFTNSVSSATTTAATLTVNTAPAVTTNPSNQTVNAGQTATFTAAATGKPTPTVQWQVSTNGGSTFANVSGATSATLSFTATAGQDGSQYRAVFTNSVGSATSTAATLTVNVAPLVTTNPTNQIVNAGQTATFTAAASGKPTPTVQWQVSTNSGANFTDIAGATSTTLSFTAAAGQNGNQYRAVFTNSLGTATTTGATLTVNSAPQITSANNASFTVGTAGSFTVTATGTPPPTFSETGTLPAGVTLNGTTGVLSGTPAPDTQGSYPLTIKASNGVPSDATQPFTLTVNGVPCTGAVSGMISWLPANNNANDLIGGNNAVMQGGATFTATGKVGQAFNFTNAPNAVTGQYASVATPVGLPLGSAARTVEMWFKTATTLTTSPNAALFQYGTAALDKSFGLVFAGSSPGKLIFNGSGDDLVGTITVTPNVWHHVAITYASDTVTWYLDGQLDRSAITNGLLNTTLDANGLTIGSRPGVAVWNGQIDEVQIFNRALTQAEVQATYYAGAQGTCAPPLTLSSAVSRRTHTGVGNFDVVLPLSGTTGIEPRGSAPAGNHTVVFTFSHNVTSGSAAVTIGTGSVSGSPTFSGSTMSVNLTGVTNAQQIAITLTGVTDALAQTLAPTAVNMAVLVGDVNSDGAVNSADATVTRNRSGQPTDATNFRADVNVDGNINSGDATIVRANSGSGL